MPCTFWTPCVRTGRSRHIFEGAGHMMLRAFRIPGTKDVRHHTFPKGLLRGPPAPTIDIAAVARPINGAVRGSGAKPGDANPEGTSVAAERVTAREFGRDHRLPPPPPGTCCTTSMMMSATRAVTGPIASGGAGRGPGKEATTAAMLPSRGACVDARSIRSTPPVASRTHAPCRATQPTCGPRPSASRASGRCLGVVPRRHAPAMYALANFASRSRCTQSCAHASACWVGAA